MNEERVLLKESELGTLVWEWAEGNDAAFQYWMSELAGPPHFITTLNSLKEMAESNHWQGFVKQFDGEMLGVKLEKWYESEGFGNGISYAIWKESFKFLPSSPQTDKPLIQTEQLYFDTTQIYDMFSEDYLKFHPPRDHFGHCFSLIIAPIGSGKTKYIIDQALVKNRYVIYIDWQAHRRLLDYLIGSIENKLVITEGGRI